MRSNWHGPFTANKHRGERNGYLLRRLERRAACSRAAPRRRVSFFRMGRYANVTRLTGWGVPRAGFCPTDQQVDELLALTQARDPDIRRIAVKNLCPCHVRRNRSDVWTRLLQLIEDPNPGVRMDVLHNLTDGFSPDLAADVVTAVETFLHDLDPTVRGYAAFLRARQVRRGTVNVG
jgi:hypothetical protein